jgi:1-acyl-sn-glycerol-3-phosphate acyltransferase
VLRTLWFQLAVVFHQLWLLPRLWAAESLARQGRLTEARSMADKTSRQWSRVLLWAAGCRVRRIGHPGLRPGEGALIVSNHQGMFDIPLIGASIDSPLAFVAKAELARVPLVGRWMVLMGCTFLQRDDRRQAVEVARETVERLREGRCMVIFPEGTRSNSPRAGEFRRGSANLALKAGARVLPVTVNHTWKLRQGDRGRITPGEVEIHFHPMVDPATLSPEQRDRLSEYLRDIILAPIGPAARDEMPAPPPAD